MGRRGVVIGRRLLARLAPGSNLINRAEERHSGSFVAVASGIDLSKPQHPGTIQEIVDGTDKCAVMIFRGQTLTQIEQVAFAHQFGPADTRLDVIMSKIQTRMECTEISDLSKVDASGKVATKDNRQAMMGIGNRIWHTDSSFMDYP